MRKELDCRFRKTDENTKSKNDFACFIKLEAKSRFFCLKTGKNANKHKYMIANAYMNAIAIVIPDPSTIRACEVERAPRKSIYLSVCCVGALRLGGSDLRAPAARECALRFNQTI